MGGVKPWDVMLCKSSRSIPDSGEQIAVTDPAVSVGFVVGVAVGGGGMVCVSVGVIVGTNMVGESVGGSVGEGSAAHPVTPKRIKSISSFKSSEPERIGLIANRRAFLLPGLLKYALIENWLVQGMILRASI